MNILLNGTAVKEPAELMTQWLMGQERLLRQVTLRYTALTEGEAAALLGAGVKPSVALSYRNPETGDNVSLITGCVAASAPVLREQEGEVQYGSVSLTLLEVEGP